MKKYINYHRYRDKNKERKGKGGRGEREEMICERERERGGGDLFNPLSPHKSHLMKNEIRLLSECTLLLFKRIHILF